ncbi:MAG: hypothetical protein P1U68_04350 [Verrucomicrobiales bacterium]|nr:hypothetical protein [Verrucomicrobiales bacterium]
MRAKSFLAALTFSLAGALVAQDTVEAPQLSKTHNYIKLLAQEAALPSLRGQEKFILRESWWSGNLAPGKAKLIQLQLFRRNSYQFWIAVPNRKAEPLINVYDSSGNLVSSEAITFDTGNLVSTVIQPEETGVYYLRVSLKTTVEDAQDWAVIYAYR